MWAMVAVLGKPAMLSWQVCVAWILVLLGSWTRMPLDVGTFWWQGFWMCRKWPVHPVSAMMGGGEPRRVLLTSVSIVFDW